MNFSGSGYGIVTVIGGFLLLAVLAYAALRNRQAGGIHRAEKGARDLYRETDREDKARDEKR